MTTSEATITPVDAYSRFPFDREFEARVFCATIGSQTFLSQFSDIIEADYFTQPNERTIVKVVLNLTRRYKIHPTLVMVLQELRDTGKREQWPAEDMQAIMGLAVQGTRIGEGIGGELAYLQDKVTQFLRLRAVRVATTDLAWRLREADEKGDASVLVGYDKIMSKAFATGPRSPTINVLDYVMDPKSLEQADPLSNPIYRVPIGIPSIDDAIDGGPGAGEVLMFLGPSNVGKSMALVSVAASAVKRGKRVAFISTEMKPAQSAFRIIASLVGYPMRDLGTLEYRAAAARFLEDYPGRVIRSAYFPPSTATVASVRAWLTSEEARSDFRPEIIILDYLDELKTSGRAAGDLDENTFLSQGTITEELIELGVDYMCPVATATQTNRKGYSGTPSLEDTGRSIAKVEKSDFIVAMSQDPEERDNNRMSYTLLKVRRGQHKGRKVPVVIDFSKAQISELQVATNENPYAGVSNELLEQAQQAFSTP